MKDEHFNKVLSKLQKNGTVREEACNFRKLVVGKKPIKIYKGKTLTPDELELFDTDAKKYWLTNA